MNLYQKMSAITNEWEDVEKYPYTLDEYLKWQEQGYKTEVQW